MHSRTFHVLCALAFALTGAAGVLLAWASPRHSDGHGILLALLLTVAFAGVAWMQPAPSAQCRSCGGLRGDGLPFCMSCGDASANPPARA